MEERALFVTKPSWDEYLMGFALQASSRGTCDRLQVGAVLVDKDNGIVATGYNGAPRGVKSCDEVGCLMVNGRCEGSLHAELNALLQAGRNGASTLGARMYCTYRPCHRCTLHIIQAGVKEVVFLEDYKSDNLKLVMDLFSESGVTLRRMVRE